MNMTGLKRRNSLCLLVLCVVICSFIASTMILSSSHNMWLWLSQQPFSGNIAGIMIRCDSDKERTKESYGQAFVSANPQETRRDSNEDRKRRIQHLCRTTHRSLADITIYDKPARLENILVDDTLKTMFCYVPKASSTSWKYVLVNASKSQHEPQDAAQFRDVHSSAYKALNRLHSYTPEDIKYRIDNYFKFMVVRHPLERLGSAYYDRFYLIEQGNTDHGNTVTYRAHRDEIIHLTKDSDLSGSCIGFDRFVKYLTLTDPSVFNEHWALFEQGCSPCQLQYDYIGKVETMDTDAPQILKRLNLSNVEFPSYHVHHKANSSYLPYYDKVSPEDLQTLLKIYKVDFDLFGYYMPVVRDSRNAGQKSNDVGLA